MSEKNPFAIGDSLETINKFYSSEAAYELASPWNYSFLENDDDLLAAASSYIEKGFSPFAARQAVYADIVSNYDGDINEFKSDVRQNRYSPSSVNNPYILSAAVRGYAERIKRSPKSQEIEMPKEDFYYYPNLEFENVIQEQKIKNKGGSPFSITTTYAGDNAEILVIGNVEKDRPASFSDGSALSSIWSATKEGGVRAIVNSVVSLSSSLGEFVASSSILDFDRDDYLSYKNERRGVMSRFSSQDNLNALALAKAIKDYAGFLAIDDKEFKDAIVLYENLISNRRNPKLAYLNDKYINRIWNIYDKFDENGKKRITSLYLKYKSINEGIKLERAAQNPWFNNFSEGLLKGLNAATYNIIASYNIFNPFYKDYNLDSEYAYYDLVRRGVDEKTILEMKDRYYSQNQFIENVMGAVGMIAGIMNILSSGYLKFGRFKASLSGQMAENLATKILPNLAKLEGASLKAKDLLTVKGWLDYLGRMTYAFAKGSANLHMHFKLGLPDALREKSWEDLSTGEIAYALIAPGIESVTENLILSDVSFKLGRTFAITTKNYAKAVFANSISEAIEEETSQLLQELMTIKDKNGSPYLQSAIMQAVYQDKNIMDVLFENELAKETFASSAIFNALLYLIFAKQANGLRKKLYENSTKIENKLIEHLIERDPKVREEVENLIANVKGVVDDLDFINENAENTVRLLSYIFAVGVAQNSIIFNKVTNNASGQTTKEQEIKAVSQDIINDPEFKEFKDIVLADLKNAKEEDRLKNKVASNLVYGMFLTLDPKKIKENKNFFLKFINDIADNFNYFAYKAIRSKIKEAIEKALADKIDPDKEEDAKNIIDNLIEEYVDRVSFFGFNSKNIGSPSLYVTPTLDKIEDVLKNKDEKHSALNDIKTYLAKIYAEANAAFKENLNIYAKDLKKGLMDEFKNKADNLNNLIKQFQDEIKKILDDIKPVKIYKENEVPPDIKSKAYKIAEVEDAKKNFSSEASKIFEEQIEDDYFNEDIYLVGEDGDVVIMPDGLDNDKIKSKVDDLRDAYQKNVNMYNEHIKSLELEYNLFNMALSKTDKSFLISMFMKDLGYVEDRKMKLNAIKRWIFKIKANKNAQASKPFYEILNRIIEQGKSFYKQGGKEYRELEKLEADIREFAELSDKKTKSPFGRVTLNYLKSLLTLLTKQTPPNEMGLGDFQVAQEAFETLELMKEVFDLSPSEEKEITDLQRSYFKEFVAAPIRYYEKNKTDNFYRNQYDLFVKRAALLAFEGIPVSDLQMLKKLIDAFEQAIQSVLSNKPDEANKVLLNIVDEIIGKESKKNDIIKAYEKLIKERISDFIEASQENIGNLSKIVSYAKISQKFSKQSEDFYLKENLGKAELSEIYEGLENLAKKTGADINELAKNINHSLKEEVSEILRIGVSLNLTDPQEFAELADYLTSKDNEDFVKEIISYDKDKIREAIEKKVQTEILPALNGKKLSDLSNQEAAAILRKIRNLAFLLRLKFGGITEKTLEDLKRKIKLLLEQVEPLDKFGETAEKFSQEAAETNPDEENYYPKTRFEKNELSKDILEIKSEIILEDRIDFILTEALKALEEVLEDSLGLDKAILASVEKVIENNSADLNKIDKEKVSLEEANIAQDDILSDEEIMTEDKELFVGNFLDDNYNKDESKGKAWLLSKVLFKKSRKMGLSSFSLKRHRLAKLKGLNKTSRLDLGVVDLFLAKFGIAYALSKKDFYKNLESKGMVLETDNESEKVYNLLTYDADVRVMPTEEEIVLKTFIYPNDTNVFDRDENGELIVDADMIKDTDALFSSGSSIGLLKLIAMARNPKLAGKLSFKIENENNYPEIAVIANDKEVFRFKVSSDILRRVGLEEDALKSLELLLKLIIHKEPIFMPSTESEDKNKTSGKSKSKGKGKDSEGKTEEVTDEKSEEQQEEEETPDEDQKTEEEEEKKEEEEEEKEGKEGEEEKEGKTKKDQGKDEDKNENKYKILPSKSVKKLFKTKAKLKEAIKKLKDNISGLGLFEARLSKYISDEKEVENVIDRAVETIIEHINDNFYADRPKHKFDSHLAKKVASIFNEYDEISGDLLYFFVRRLIFVYENSKDSGVFRDGILNKNKNLKKAIREAINSLMVASYFKNYKGSNLIDIESEFNYDNYEDYLEIDASNCKEEIANEIRIKIAGLIWQKIKNAKSKTPFEEAFKKVVGKNKNNLSKKLEDFFASNLQEIPDDIKNLADKFAESYFDVNKAEKLYESLGFSFESVLNSVKDNLKYLIDPKYYPAFRMEKAGFRRVEDFFEFLKYFFEGQKLASAKRDLGKIVSFYKSLNEALDSLYNHVKDDEKALASFNRINKVGHVIETRLETVLKAFRDLWHVKSDYMLKDNLISLKTLANDSSHDAKLIKYAIFNQRKVDYKGVETASGYYLYKDIEAELLEKFDLRVHFLYDKGLKANGRIFISSINSNENDIFVIFKEAGTKSVFLHELAHIFMFPLVLKVIEDKSEEFLKFALAFQKFIRKEHLGEGAYNSYIIRKIKNEGLDFEKLLKEENDQGKVITVISEFFSELLGRDTLLEAAFHYATHKEPKIEELYKEFIKYVERAFKINVTGNNRVRNVAPLLENIIKRDLEEDDNINYLLEIFLALADKFARDDFEDKNLREKIYKIIYGLNLYARSNLGDEDDLKKNIISERAGANIFEVVSSGFADDRFFVDVGSIKGLADYFVDFANAYSKKNYSKLPDPLESIKQLSYEEFKTVIDNAFENKEKGNSYQRLIARYYENKLSAYKGEKENFFKEEYSRLKSTIKYDFIRLTSGKESEESVFVVEEIEGEFKQKQPDGSYVKRSVYDYKTPIIDYANLLNKFFESVNLDSKIEVKAIADIDGKDVRDEDAFVIEDFEGRYKAGESEELASVLGVEEGSIPNTAIMASVLYKQGYAYLLPFAEKSRAFAFKIDRNFEKFIDKVLLPLYFKYSEKLKDDEKFVLTKDNKNEFRALAASVGLRYLLEEIKYGNKLEDFVKVKFDKDNSFDSAEIEFGDSRINYLNVVEMMKRNDPTISLREGLIDENAQAILSLGGFFRDDETGEIMFKAVSFTDDDLLDSLGQFRFDGAVFYLEGAFDKAYETAFGAGRNSVLKNWIIINRNFWPSSKAVEKIGEEEKEYKAPESMLQKIAMFPVPPDSKLGKLMAKKGLSIITFESNDKHLSKSLRKDSSYKKKGLFQFGAETEDRRNYETISGSLLKSYAKGENQDDIERILEEKAFAIPFKNVYRLMEGDSEKEESYGFQQSINSSGLSLVLLENEEDMETFENLVNAIIKYNFANLLGCDIEEFYDDEQEEDEDKLKEFLRNASFVLDEAVYYDEKAQSYALRREYLKKMNIDEILGKAFLNKIKNPTSEPSRIMSLIFYKFKDAYETAKTDGEKAKIIKRLAQIAKNLYGLTFIYSSLSDFYGRKQTDAVKMKTPGSMCVLAPDPGNLVYENQNDEDFDENGFLKENRIRLSQDVLDRLKLKIGDSVIIAIVPTDSVMGFMSMKIAGTSKLGKNAIEVNSENIRIVGKDYDFDKIVVVKKPSFLGDKEWNDINEKIKKLWKDQTKKLVDLYEGENSISVLVDGKANLKLMQKSFGATNLKDVYMTGDKNIFKLADVFKKKVGYIITLRQLQTLLGYCDAAIEVYDGKEIVGKYKAADNYVKAYNVYRIITNYEVDYPKTIDKDLVNYDRDKLLAFMFDEKSDESEHYQQIISILKIFNSIFNPLLNLPREFRTGTLTAVRSTTYKFQDTLDVLYKLENLGVGESLSVKENVKIERISDDVYRLTVYEKSNEPLCSLSFSISGLKKYPLTKIATSFGPVFAELSQIMPTLSENILSKISQRYFFAIGGMALKEVKSFLPLFAESLANETAKNYSNYGEVVAKIVNKSFKYSYLNDVFEFSADVEGLSEVISSLYNDFFLSDVFSDWMEDNVEILDKVNAIGINAVRIPLRDKESPEIYFDLDVDETFNVSFTEFVKSQFVSKNLGKYNLESYEKFFEDIGLAGYLDSYVGNQWRYNFDIAKLTYISFIHVLYEYSKNKSIFEKREEKDEKTPKAKFVGELKRIKGNVKIAEIEKKYGVMFIENKLKERRKILTSKDPTYHRLRYLIDWGNVYSRSFNSFLRSGHYWIKNFYNPLGLESFNLKPTRYKIDRLEDVDEELAAITVALTYAQSLIPNFKSLNYEEIKKLKPSYFSRSELKALKEAYEELGIIDDQEEDLNRTADIAVRSLKTYFESLINGARNYMAFVNLMNELFYISNGYSRTSMARIRDIEDVGDYESPFETEGYLSHRSGNKYKDMAIYEYSSRHFYFVLEQVLNNPYRTQEQPAILPFFVRVDDKAECAALIAYKNGVELIKIEDVKALRKYLKNPMSATNFPSTGKYGGFSELPSEIKQAILETYSEQFPPFSQNEIENQSYDPNYQPAYKEERKKLILSSKLGEAYSKFLGREPDPNLVLSAFVLIEEAKNRAAEALKFYDYKNFAPRQRIQAAINFIEYMNSVLQPEEREGFAKLLKAALMANMSLRKSRFSDFSAANPRIFRANEFTMALLAEYFPKELETAIRKMLNEADKAKKFGEKASEIAFDFYSGQVPEIDADEFPNAAESLQFPDSIAKDNYERIIKLLEYVEETKEDFEKYNKYVDLSREEFYNLEDEDKINLLYFMAAYNEKLWYGKQDAKNKTKNILVNALKKKLETIQEKMIAGSLKDMSFNLDKLLYGIYLDLKEAIDWNEEAVAKFSEMENGLTLRDVFLYDYLIVRRFDTKEFSAYSDPEISQIFSQPYLIFEKQYERGNLGGVSSIEMTKLDGDKAIITPTIEGNVNVVTKTESDNRIEQYEFVLFRPQKTKNSKTKELNEKLHEMFDANPDLKVGTPSVKFVNKYGAVQTKTLDVRYIKASEIRPDSTCEITFSNNASVKFLATPKEEFKEYYVYGFKRIDEKTIKPTLLGETSLDKVNWKKKKEINIENAQKNFVISPYEIAQIYKFAPERIEASGLQMFGIGQTIFAKLEKAIMEKNKLKSKFNEYLGARNALVNELFANKIGESKVRLLTKINSLIRDLEFLIGYRLTNASIKTLGEPGYLTRDLVDKNEIVITYRQSSKTDPKGIAVTINSPLDPTLIELFEEAVERKPEYVNALRELGWANAQGKIEAEAMKKIIQTALLGRYFYSNFLRKVANNITSFLTTLLENEEVKESPYRFELRALLNEAYKFIRLLASSKSEGNKFWTREDLTYFVPLMIKAEDFVEVYARKLRDEDEQPQDMDFYRKKALAMIEGKDAVNPYYYFGKTFYETDFDISMDYFYSEAYFLEETLSKFFNWMTAAIRTQYEIYVNSTGRLPNNKLDKFLRRIFAKYMPSFGYDEESESVDVSELKAGDKVAFFRTYVGERAEEKIEMALETLETMGLEEEEIERKKRELIEQYAGYSRITGVVASADEDYITLENGLSFRKSEIFVYDESKKDIEEGKVYLIKDEDAIRENDGLFSKLFDKLSDTFLYFSVVMPIRNLSFNMLNKFGSWAMNKSLMKKALSEMAARGVMAKELSSNLKGTIESLSSYAGVSLDMNQTQTVYYLKQRALLPEGQKTLTLKDALVMSLTKMKGDENVEIYNKAIRNADKRKQAYEMKKEIIERYSAEMSDQDVQLLLADNPEAISGANDSELKSKIEAYFEFIKDIENYEETKHLPADKKEIKKLRNEYVKSFNPWEKTGIAYLNSKDIEILNRQRSFATAFNYYLSKGLALEQAAIAAKNFVRFTNGFYEEIYRRIGTDNKKLNRFMFLLGHYTKEMNMMLRIFGAQYLERVKFEGGVFEYSKNKKYDYYDFHEGMNRLFFTQAALFGIGQYIGLTSYIMIPMFYLFFQMIKTLLDAISDDDEEPRDYEILFLLKNMIGLTSGVGLSYIADFGYLGAKTLAGKARKEDLIYLTPGAASKIIYAQIKPPSSLDSFSNDLASFFLPIRINKSYFADVWRSYSNPNSPLSERYGEILLKLIPLYLEFEQAIDADDNYRRRAKLARKLEFRLKKQRRAYYNELDEYSLF